MTSETKGNIVGLLFVVCIAAIGIYVLSIGLGQFRRSPNDAPGWVMIAAGAAFLLAASSMGLSAIGGLAGAKTDRHGALTDAPFAIRVAQIALSLGVIAMLALVATWVAINPGPGSSLGRRIAFGSGAAMVWGILLFFAVLRLRRLKP